MKKRNITLFTAIAAAAALASSAQAALIAGVSASAKDNEGVRTATKAVDGSGMTGVTVAGTGMHDVTGDNMWLGQSSTNAGPQWINVDLGGLYTVGDMYMWNYKEGGGGDGGRQVLTYNLWYSVDASATPGNFTDTKWTQLGGTINAGQVGAGSSYSFSDQITINQDASVIGFEILTAVDNRAGIAELQFDGTLVPEPSSMSLLALGGLALLRRRRA